MLIYLFSGAHCAFAGISFGDEPGLFAVNNQTDFDAVVFAGKVEHGIVLGGVKANSSRNFDLAKIAGLPQKGNFFARVVPFDTYTEKKAEVTENDVIFTALVIYDLSKTDTRIELNISKLIDGTRTYWINAANPSPYILELRLGSALGEKIAALLPQSGNKRIWIKPSKDGKPYGIFPRYVYTDIVTGFVQSGMSPHNFGDMQFADPATDTVAMLKFTAPDYHELVQYGVGFVQLYNNTAEGLEFWDGQKVLSNKRGRNYTAAWAADMFELSATQGGTDGQLYPNLHINYDNGTKTWLERVKIKRGYQYDLTLRKKDSKYVYELKENGMKIVTQDEIRVPLFGE